MPMVRRGDRDGVDVLIREHITDVLICLDVSAVDRGLHLGQHGGIGVAERDDAHAGNLREALEMIAPAAIEADDSDTNVTAGSHDLTPRRGGKGGAGGREGRGLQERTTGQWAPRAEAVGGIGQTNGDEEGRARRGLRWWGLQL